MRTLRTAYRAWAGRSQARQQKLGAPDLPGFTGRCGGLTGESLAPACSVAENEQPGLAQMIAEQVGGKKSSARMPRAWDRRKSNLWPTETMSPHATCEYSPIGPGPFEAGQSRSAGWLEGCQAGRWPSRPAAIVRSGQGLETGHVG